MSTEMLPSTEPNSQKIEALEVEIKRLEHELLVVGNEINAFVGVIRARMASQIRLLNELTDLYKAQKKLKKDQRLEQKKKGKNYQEPTGSVASYQREPTHGNQPSSQQAELKRLYKEAIVRVHPDKFATENEDTSLRATEVTSQLVALYKAGELNALRDYHEYILSGNAMSYVPFTSQKATDPISLLSFLRKNRNELRQKLEEMKASRLYVVLTTYEDSGQFVEELRIAYAERIEVLHKRTRTKPTAHSG